MVKRIFMLLMIMMTIFSLGSCKRTNEIDFEVGSASADRFEQSIQIIVRSLEEWSSSNASKTIAIDEKYDDVFFADKALVIVSFQTTSSGCEVQDIKVSKNNNYLMVDINGTDGTDTMIGGVIVVFEVDKVDINGVNNIKYTTNITQLKQT